LWAYYKYHGLLLRVRRFTCHMKRDPVIATYHLMRHDNATAAAFRGGRPVAGQHSTQEKEAISVGSHPS
jgi:hypothetical protein